MLGGYLVRVRSPGDKLGDCIELCPRSRLAGVALAVEEAAAAAVVAEATVVAVAVAPPAAHVVAIGGVGVDVVVVVVVAVVHFALDVGPAHVVVILAAVLHAGAGLVARAFLFSDPGVSVDRGADKASKGTATEARSRELLLSRGFFTRYLVLGRELFTVTPEGVETLVVAIGHGAEAVEPSTLATPEGTTSPRDGLGVLVEASVTDDTTSESAAAGVVRLVVVGARLGSRGAVGASAGASAYLPEDPPGFQAAGTFFAV